MPLVTDPVELLSEVKTLNLESPAEQWTCFATYSQFRIPLQKTAAYLTASSRALDWGCGTGHLSYFLTRNGIRTVGYSFIDPPAFLRSSPLFKHVRGSESEPVKLPFEANAFDLVFSSGVLEHVHECGGDQKASLAEIHRILKPGGVFICFHLPNRYTWIEFLVRQANRWLGMHMHQHTKLFTYEDFSALTQGTTFKIIDSGRYNIIPRNRLEKLPDVLTDSRAGARTIDWLDHTFSTLFPWFCQQWFFIVQKETQ